MTNPMPDNPHQSSFHTLILDVWGEPGPTPNEITWWFRLRDVRTGQHHSFASLDALFEHLTRQFGDEPADDS